MRWLRLFLLIVSLNLCVIPEVRAKAPGDWLLRVGAGKFHPKGKNGGFDNPYLPGTEMELDVESSAGGRVDLTWMFSDHWALEAMATTPASHEIVYEHGLVRDGLGIVGESKRVSMMIAGQYHFYPTGRYQPYVGAGLHATFFYDGSARDPLDGDTISFDDTFGPAVQIGLDVFISERIILNGSARYLWMRTDLRVDDAKVTKAEIDGVLWGVHIGYRF